MKSKIYIIVWIIFFLLIYSCGKSVHKSENWILTINSVEFAVPGLKASESKDSSGAKLALNLEITYIGPDGNRVMPEMYLIKDMMKITSSEWFIEWKNGKDIQNPESLTALQKYELNLQKERMNSIMIEDKKEYSFKKGDKITKYKTIFYFPISKKEELSNIKVMFDDIPPFSIE